MKPTGVAFKNHLIRLNAVPDLIAEIVGGFVVIGTGIDGTERMMRLDFDKAFEIVCKLPKKAGAVAVWNALMEAKIE